MCLSLRDTGPLRVDGVAALGFAGSGAARRRRVAASIPGPGVLLSCKSAPGHAQFVDVTVPRSVALAVCNPLDVRVLRVHVKTSKLGIEQRLVAELMMKGVV